MADNTIAPVSIHKEEDLVLVHTADKLESQAIKIYPNPTKYGIYIDLLQVVPQTNYVVQVIDANGRLIFKQALQGTNNWVDFTNKPIEDGIYRVHVLANDELLTNRGLVVVKDY